MNFLKSLFKQTNPGSSAGAIPYGTNKQDGSHDHRQNRGDDRTPAQKQGDEKRRKP